MALNGRLKFDGGEVIIESKRPLQELENQVSSFEWVESQRFKSQSRRCEWLMSRATVRRELRSMGLSVDQVAQVIEYAPCGAPLLSRELNANLNISISHSRDCVAVALSERRCAVDIEQPERRVEHLLSRFASPREVEIVESLELNPLVLWCAKESLYKMAGRSELSFIDDLVVDSMTKNSDGTISLDCTIAHDSKLKMTSHLTDDYLLVVGGVKNYEL
ncbi:MAG: 4'-phosphopantetheinyl transferase superfamily protein [Rikenellaceae bacterium]